MLSLFPIRSLRAVAGVRHLSNGGAGLRVISYDALRERMIKGDVTVVDVREPHEVKDTGALHHGKVKALNVPLGRVMEGVLGNKEDAFKNEFGFEKPKADQTVVFSCRSGVRSDKAANQAISQHGYKDVFNYKGSALEWFSKK